MSQLLRPHALVQVPALASKHRRRTVYALFVLAASGISIGIITAIAFWTGNPLVVPSLGPTAFLVFNRSSSVVARPRNIVVGHLIGVLAGYVALLAFGLEHEPSVVNGGLTAGRIGAAALSIALTSAVMILAGTEHGPAGATTLIVSLGFMTTPGSLGLLMVGVVGLAIEGVIIDRLAGLRLPYWAGPHMTGGSRARARARERATSLVVGPGEGRRERIGDDECAVKVERADAPGMYSVLEVAFHAHSPSAGFHVHHDFTETYFVLEGELVIEMWGRRTPAVTGSTIVVPADVPHLVTVVGDGPARCLCVTEPSHQSDPEFLP